MTRPSFLHVLSPAAAEAQRLEAFELATRLNPHPLDRLPSEDPPATGPGESGRREVELAGPDAVLRSS